MLCLFYEYSTIFLHSYILLNSCSLYNLAKISRLLFLLVFILVRNIFGLYITFEIWNVFIFDNNTKPKNKIK